MAESIFMARLNTGVDVIKDPFKRQGVIDAILNGYDSAKTEGDKLYYSNLAAHVYATAAADTFNIDQAEFQKFKTLEDAALNAGLLEQAANIPSTLGKVAVKAAENFMQTTQARLATFSNDPATAMLAQYMQPALHLASRHVLDPKRDDISGTLEALSNVFATPVNVTQHVQGIYTDTEREQLSLIYKQPSPDARLVSLQGWRAKDVVDVANIALLPSAVSMAAAMEERSAVVQMEMLFNQYFRMTSADLAALPDLVRPLGLEEVSQEMMQKNLEAIKQHYAELMSPKSLARVAGTHQAEYTNLFKILAKPFSEDALAGKEVPELMGKWQTAISASQGQDYESVRTAVHNLYYNFRLEGGFMEEEEFNALNATSSYDGLVKSGRIQTELLKTPRSELKSSESASIMKEPPDISM